MNSLRKASLTGIAFGALMLASGPVIAQSETPLKTVHNPTEMIDSTQYGYSQAVSVPATARTIYIAGQVGHSADGPNDFETQVDRSFDNLLTVLKAAGGKPENIVRITLLIKDYDPEKLAYIGKKRRKIFGATPPASVLIPVTRLYIDAVSFEISAVAVTD